VTETKLPEELEEQAMLHALGALDPEDRQAFMVRLQGESELLRQAVMGYQAATEALASAVAPVRPPSILRKRLISRVALEAAHEAEQFELAADTLALGSIPVPPRDSVRERLLSRIEGHSDIRLDVRDASHGLAETHDAGLRSSRLSYAWRHLLVTSYTSLRLCWKAFANLLRTLLVRSGSFDRSRFSKTKIGFQRTGKGLTFIKAAEGVWREIAPGVKAKVLSFDMVSRRATTLLRIAPGTSYAPHRHTEMEELFVLEGGCLCGGRELKVGDYHRAEAGTEHHDTSSNDGCLLLVISSPQNEMLS
jgi:quercetin dioxygenase-like cupin family protein